MNVTELKQQLDEALEKGLHPETTVVIDLQGEAFKDNPSVRWYVLLEDQAEHPLDGQEGADLWFTLTPREEDGETVHADPRFTPGHEVRADPTLYAEFQEDYDAVVAQRITYTDWLQERYDGLAGALRDDPPRAREELATDYRALAAYLTELERMS